MSSQDTSEVSEKDDHSDDTNVSMEPSPRRRQKTNDNNDNGKSRKNKENGRMSKKMRITNLEIRLAQLEGILAHKQKPAVANAGVLGLLGFAFSAIVSGYTLAGSVESSGSSIVIVWGFWIGGVLQLISGLWEVHNGVLFGAWAFTYFGLNSMAGATYEILVKLKVLEAAGTHAQLGKLIFSIVFIAMLLVISFRISMYHIPLVASVLIALILEAIALSYPAIKGWSVAAGSFYIIAGILAYWLAFTQVFNEYWRLNILPWWPYIYGSDDHVKGSSHPYFPKVDDHKKHDVSGFKTTKKKID